MPMLIKICGDGSLPNKTCPYNNSNSVGVSKLVPLMALIISILIICPMIGFGTFRVVQFLTAPINSPEELTGLPDHQIENIRGQFQLVWENPNIPLTKPSALGNLTAIDNKAFFLATDFESPATVLSLVGVDLATGNILSTVKNEFREDLAHNTKTIFAGSNNGVISAYDGQSGKLLWTQNLSGVNSITYAVATETKLIVGTSPSKTFMLDASTGQSLHTLQASVGTKIFFIDDNYIMYSQPAPQILQASDQNTGNVLWTVRVADGFETIPTFLDSFILLKSFGGQLFSIDRESGHIVWQTETPYNLTHAERIVSNVAFANDIVYFLTQDAQLRALDIYTGEILGTVQFDPSLFELGVNIVNERFDVAASNDIVLIYFGDSWQIFAFRFSPIE